MKRDVAGDACVQKIIIISRRDRYFDKKLRFKEQKTEP